MLYTVLGGFSCTFTQYFTEFPKKACFKLRPVDIFKLHMLIIGNEWLQYKHCKQKLTLFCTAFLVHLSNHFQTKLFQ